MPYDFLAWAPRVGEDRHVPSFGGGRCSRDTVVSIRAAAVLAILVAIPYPAAAAVVVTQVHSGVDNAYAANVSTTDLVNKGAPTLASFTGTQAPRSGAGGENDGKYRTSGSAAAFYPWKQSGRGKLPLTLTFTLNLKEAARGYDIVSIDSFAGWKGEGAQVYANQKLEIEYQIVGSSGWTLLSSVDYSPFTGSTSSAPANTWVKLTGARVLASGVRAIRFTYAPPPEARPGSQGIAIQEIDVIGYRTGMEATASLSLTRPLARQILQRSAAGTGAIPISGFGMGPLELVEARAVVMAGSNTGSSTDWQPIATAPAGAFTGALAGVAAGGWYQVEVRMRVRGVASTSIVVEQIGVGDIYITAGQSNSANHGTRAKPASDDWGSAWSFTGTWTRAADPMPGCSGTGGSVWTRLGPILRARSGVPVGFVCLGEGGTRVAQWVPGADLYPRIRAAVQAFPADGFSAVLWHQGESDSAFGTTRADYESRLESIIARSRVDGGWPVPWYVAEAGSYPAGRLAQVERVVAAQRRVVFADPLVFLGPTTDDFRLEGKLHDTVHFNERGLADHAMQWAALLSGTAALAPKNLDFERNLPPLADGGSRVVKAASPGSPSIVAWRVLSASGDAAADGKNGIYNPGAALYPDAGDAGPLGGVPSGMQGRHVGFLAGGAAGNHLLQALRARVQPARSYTLTVALGVRRTAETFGGARLELLLDGQPLGAPLQISRADLDARNGGHAAGRFTDVTLTATTGASVSVGATLAVRITKVAGGGNSYLDLDNVRLTSTTP
jgi:hypothetical protein